MPGWYPEHELGTSGGKTQDLRSYGVGLASKTPLASKPAASWLQSIRPSSSYDACEPRARSAQEAEAILDERRGRG